MRSRLDQVKDRAALAKASNYCALKLALECRVSTRQLERYFRIKYGEPPHQWLWELRLRRAVELIRDQTLMKEVAVELGYKHPTRFARDFKKHFGVSLSRFVHRPPPPVSRQMQRDRKGISGLVELLSQTNVAQLTGWQVFNLPLDEKELGGLHFRSGTTNTPAFHRVRFSLGETGDSFLDMSTWGKGVVWVNGHNLGRYWNIGPQQTLYCPGPWLKRGKNIGTRRSDRAAKPTPLGIEFQTWIVTHA